MLITLLSYLPIVAGPLLAVGLTAVLRRWVKPTVVTLLPTAGTEPVSAVDTGPDELTWEDITTQTNPLVAYVLPIFTSAAIVLLALWPFAYLGWTVIELDPDPGWSAQVPPWFGNPAYFLGFGLVGLVLAVVGGVIVAGLGVGLHTLGKCILWPALCACFDAYDEGDEGDEDEDDKSDDAT